MFVCLGEAFLMSTDNICFMENWRKLSQNYPKVLPLECEDLLVHPGSLIGAFALRFKNHRLLYDILRNIEHPDGTA